MQDDVDKLLKYFLLVIMKMRGRTLYPCTSRAHRCEIFVVTQSSMLKKDPGLGLLML